MTQSKTRDKKMSRETYYKKVKKLVKNAIEHIAEELHGNYKGYTGANAVSLYMNDKHDINVTCDDEAQRAFNDAWHKAN